MKRKIAIAAGILVTAVSTISGSYAYYQDSVTVTNHISTGDVNIGIQEYEKDGDTEKVYEELFDLHDLRILRKAFLYLEDQSVWRLSGLPVSEMRRTARDNDKHGWII